MIQRELANSIAQLERDLRAADGNGSGFVSSADFERAVLLNGGLKGHIKALLKKYGGDRCDEVYYIHFLENMRRLASGSTTSLHAPRSEEGNTANTFAPQPYEAKPAQSFKARAVFSARPNCCHYGCSQGHPPCRGVDAVECVCSCRIGTTSDWHVCPGVSEGVARTTRTSCEKNCRSKRAEFCRMCGEMPWHPIATVVPEVRSFSARMQRGPSVEQGGIYRGRRAVFPSPKSNCVGTTKEKVSTLNDSRFGRGEAWAGDSEQEGSLYNAEEMVPSIPRCTHATDPERLISLRKVFLSIKRDCGGKVTLYDVWNALKCRGIDIPLVELEVLADSLDLGVPCNDNKCESGATRSEEDRVLGAVDFCLLVARMRSGLIERIRCSSLWDSVDAKVDTSEHAAPAELSLGVNEELRSITAEDHANSEAKVNARAPSEISTIPSASSYSVPLARTSPRPDRTSQGCTFASEREQGHAAWRTQHASNENHLLGAVVNNNSSEAFVSINEKSCDCCAADLLPQAPEPSSGLVGDSYSFDTSMYVPHSGRCELRRTGQRMPRNALLSPAPASGDDFNNVEPPARITSVYDEERERQNGQMSCALAPVEYHTQHSRRTNSGEQQLPKSSPIAIEVKPTQRLDGLNVSDCRHIDCECPKLASCTCTDHKVEAAAEDTHQQADRVNSHPCESICENASNMRGERGMPISPEDVGLTLSGQLTESAGGGGSTEQEECPGSPKSSLQDAATVPRKAGGAPSSVELHENQYRSTGGGMAKGKDEKAFPVGSRKQKNPKSGMAGVVTTERREQAAPQRNVGSSGATETSRSLAKQVARTRDKAKLTSAAHLQSSHDSVEKTQGRRVAPATKFGAGGHPAPHNRSMKRMETRATPSTGSASSYSYLNRSCNPAASGGCCASCPAPPSVSFSKQAASPKDYGIRDGCSLPKQQKPAVCSVCSGEGIVPCDEIPQVPLPGDLLAKLYGKYPDLLTLCSRCDRARKGWVTREELEQMLLRVAPSLAAEEVAALVCASTDRGGIRRGCNYISLISYLLLLEKNAHQDTQDLSCMHSKGVTAGVEAPPQDDQGFDSASAAGAATEERLKTRRLLKKELLEACGGDRERFLKVFFSFDNVRTGYLSESVFRDCLVQLFRTGRRPLSPCLLDQFVKLCRLPLELESATPERTEPPPLSAMVPPPNSKEEGEARVRVYNVPRSLWTELCDYRYMIEALNV